MQKRFFPLMISALILTCAQTASAQSAIEMHQDYDQQLAALVDDIPGFAGFNQSADGRVTVKIANPTGVRSKVVTMLREAELSRIFAAPAKIENTTYDFRQLLTFKNRATAFLDRGAVFVDIDESNNRVVIGIDSNLPKARRISLMQAIARTIPSNALGFEVAQPVTQRSSLRNYRNPAPGGMQVETGPGVNCTLGVPVNLGGAPGFVTAEHCKWPANVGAEVSQGGVIIGFVSKYGASATCPSGTTGTCKHADAIFIKADSKTYPQWGIVARTAGLNQLTITGTSKIIAVQSNPGTSVTVRKTGRTTGETTGTAARTCVNYRGGTTKVTYLCLNEFWGLSRDGDSGAPIYSATTGGVNLHGILFGGGTRDGKEFTVYSPWQNVQRALGTLSLTSP